MESLRSSVPKGFLATHVQLELTNPDMEVVELAEYLVQCAYNWQTTVQCNYRGVYISVHWQVPRLIGAIVDALKHGGPPISV